MPSPAVWSKTPASYISETKVRSGQVLSDVREDSRCLQHGEVRYLICHTDQVKEVIRMLSDEVTLFH